MKQTWRLQLHGLLPPCHASDSISPSRDPPVNYYYRDAQQEHRQGHDTLKSSRRVSAVDQACSLTLTAKIAAESEDLDHSEGLAGCAIYV